MAHYQRGGTVALLLFVALLSSGASNPAWAQSGGIPKKIDRADCDRALFLPIIDVGHTAEDPGAISARGVAEYEFNLRLAKLIAQKLIAAGFKRTLLLETTGQAHASLAKRVERANSVSGHLFLSIHHDSVPERLRETWEYEGKKNRYSDRFKGHSIFISYDNGDRLGSLLLARLLGDQLKQHGLQYSSHYTLAIMGNRRRILVDAKAGVYRYDQLIALKSTRIPAVLLEAGVIANRDEELLLTSPEHQSLISAAVNDAVEMFCALRLVRRRR